MPATVLLALLLLGLALTPLAVRADYVVAPDTVAEYRQLRARTQTAPQDANAQFEYALCLSYLGDIEEARRVLKQVRTLDPDFARKALPSYLKQQRERPQDLKAKYRLGFLYYFNNDYAQALNFLAQVADQPPPTQLSAWALGYMAVIKGKQQQWQEAENLVRRALAIEPQAYGLHAALALALKNQGKYFAATRAYLTAKQEKSAFDDYAREHLP